jgi:Fibronectin type III domain
MQNKFYGAFITLMLLIGLNHTMAASVSLSWNQNSDPAITGYNIYYGTVSGAYTNNVTVGNIAAVTIADLQAGVTYYFVATAFDAFGDESGFSNETQFIVTGALTLSSGLNPGDPMVIKFPVAPSQWYEVQASVDLQAWTTIWQTGVATSNAWVQYSDPEAGQFPSRFYRLVLH